MTSGQHQCSLQQVETPLVFRPVCQSSNNFLMFILLQCPHEIMCPKLVLDSVIPCNFQQMYHPLPLAGVRPNSATLSMKSFSSSSPDILFPFQHNMPQTEKFSYLILTRKEPTDVDTEGVSWSRLVAPVQRRARHVHCRLCCPDGHLQHIVMTARKHGR